MITAEAVSVPRVRRRLTPEQQDLAQRYIPLARSMARPFRRTWPNFLHDFDSAALMAVVEAAEAFEPQRNVQFATFARHRIWGALRDVHRDLANAMRRRDIRGVPVAVTAPREAERNGYILGFEPEGPVGAAMEAIEAVESWLRKLPPNHAHACRQIYVHGMTQHEAARVLGIAQSRLSYMHREAMAMLNGTWGAQVLAHDGANPGDDRSDDDEVHDEG